MAGRNGSLVDPWVDELRRAGGGDPARIAEALKIIPDEMLPLVLAAIGGPPEADLPVSPLAQALELDPGYVAREHLEYLSDRLVAARDAQKRGVSTRMAVSMPPRSGKSTAISTYFPVWLLRQDPTLKIGLISHDPALSTMWGRTIRNTIENNPQLGVTLASDAGAVAEWQTTAGGGVMSRSVGQSIVGRGYNVLILDDVVRDFAAAHSATQRQAIWEWWTANAYTRLEPPYLVLMVATRWHADDLIGRTLNPEFGAVPDDWEVVNFPAIADENDVLGRAPGDPLLSPLIPDETPEAALVRWEETRRTVGSYNWASQFQGRPVPAEGAVFNMGWWRYWTTDPALVTDDGTVRLVDFNDPRAVWVDSWDAAFKGAESSDFVVGQRWMRVGANRFLHDQVRARMTFTQTLAAMRAFQDRRVHRHLVEDKANGPAIIDTLRDEIAGLKPVNPQGSKEARAQAVTPEIESGNVYLPHPREYPWVADLLSELREFARGAHDDQVDCLTQALWDLRDPGVGSVTNLARRAMPGVGRASAARTLRTR